MWNIDKKIEIWKMPWFAVYSSDWKFDGSQFVFSGPTVNKESPNEIWSVNKEGQITRLTYFQDNGKNRYEIRGLSWSPDGNKIAFIFIDILNDDTSEQNLYILDLKSGNASNYCTGPIDSIAWSPSSDQLAIISDTIDPNKGLTNREAKVLDIVNSEIIKIGDKVDMIGWINWVLP